MIGLIGERVKIHSYKELLVWQKSMKLVKLIYQLTDMLPKNEEYGLSSQMRRAAVAIPSNIAEGYGRKNLKEYIQFLYIALASSAELETQVLIVQNIYSLPNVTIVLSCLDESVRMLSSLISKLQSKKG